jgi:GDP-L-fucose synthase
MEKTMTDNYWDNKKVLVTGGAGFLGTHVVEQILRNGTPELVRIPRSKTMDLRNWKNCVKAVKDCDIIIHLAATVGGIGFNQTYPGQLFYDNALMGIQIIEAARQEEVEKCVIIGTVCAYPSCTPTPFKENYLWEGYPEETNAPYGLAKKMLLVQSQAYRQEYGFNSIYLLPVNLYGPKSNFEHDRSHVIPAIIRKFIEAERDKKPYIEVWGTGSASREFLYVEDAAQGVILATEKYNKPDPVNLGTGIEISIRDLAELIKELMNSPVEIRWDTSKPDGQQKRRLDTYMAEKEFGFVAKTSFREGLEKTIDWYQKWI